MIFEPSQAIIVLAVVVFALYAFGARTVLADRLIYMALAAGGIMLALYPDLSTWIANRVGIGRGTDLLLYMFVLFSLFYFVGLASQLRKIEQQITTLNRTIAIERAMKGQDPKAAGEEGQESE